MSSIAPIQTSESAPPLGKAHACRLREIYRSAGWPCQDPLEIDLLAAGMLDRVQAPTGHESLRVTDAGVRLLAATLAANRAALSTHESLVERVALEMSRAGRIAWRGLGGRPTLIWASAGMCWATTPKAAASPIRMRCPPSAACWCWKARGWW
jgi:hypothetical protein